MIDLKTMMRFSKKQTTSEIAMVNLTTMMWFSKKQATSESATYSSTFLAARTCVKQIFD